MINDCSSKKMEDDDLEYDITFPSPVSAGVAEDPDADQLASLDRKEPVVILLGWLGCQEKHLAKYGTFYDQNGCITIRYTAPRDVAFFQPSRLKEIACKVLDLLDDYSVADNPIFFHLFSNNGSYVYNAIVQVITGGDDRYGGLQVYGAIIDSAPGKPRLMNAARAYATSVNASGVTKYFVMISMMLYLFFTGLMAWVVAILRPGSKESNKHFLYDMMASHASRWPQMFLYSKSDKIIMHQDVEDMIRRRQKVGVEVVSVYWEDTDHVSHFRKYSEEYSRVCCRFVASCLGQEIVEEVDTEEEDGEGNQAAAAQEEDYLLSKRQ